jgi:uncharacterized protein
MDDMAMQLDSDNLPTLARGSAALGGCDLALALIMAIHAVEQHGPVPVLELGQLADDALLLPCGMVGSPTIAEERIWSGDEGQTLCEAFAAVRGRRIDALMPFHVAGASCLLAVVWAARLGLPLLDAEGMGRAFPQLHQQAMGLAGISPSPLILTDGRGNTLLLHPADDAWAEQLVRGALASLGGLCAAALYCMSGTEARGATIPGSLSLAIRLGEAMQVESGRGRLQAMTCTLGGAVLIEGRIHDVERQSGGGFARGAATVVGGGSDAGRRIRLEFQSEFLLALEDGAPCATVPDLISVLYADTCAPVGIEHLRGGQRVAVLASPAPEIWRSREGVAIAGPGAFGYEVTFSALKGEVLRG